MTELTELTLLIDNNDNIYKDNTKDVLVFTLIFAYFLSDPFEAIRQDVLKEGLLEQYM